MMSELTNIRGTAPCQQTGLRPMRSGALLRMIVRMLAIRLITLALTLASVPDPNAGSYEAGLRLTRVSTSAPRPYSTHHWSIEREVALRARKRSSERMATALMRRTATVPR